MNNDYINPQEIPFKELKNKCGIYQIRNIKNNHVYIGSSKNLKTRLKTHKNQLEKHVHLNMHLQKAYDKYGAENFIFEIIEFCSPEDRFQREQYYIDIFFGKFCYNINPKTTSPYLSYADWNEDTKERVKQSTKNYLKQHPEHIQKMQEGLKKVIPEKGYGIPIICLETGVIYPSIVEASKQTNINRTSILNCCNGKRFTANNLHWMKVSEYNKMSREEIQNYIITHNQFSQVICLETKNIYKNSKEAEKETGILSSNILNCCHKKYKVIKGLHWVFYDEYLTLSEDEIKNILSTQGGHKTKCKCIENNKIYNSIAEAARDLQVNQSKISAVCRGERKQTQGYHFIYV